MNEQIFLRHRSGLRYRECPVPFGSMYLCGDDISLVCAVFSRNTAEVEHIKINAVRGDTAPIQQGVHFLREYFARRNAPLPELDLQGYTEREQRIYAALLTIPPGSVVSYGGLADMAGIPRGGRFAGNAMAKNRFPVFIPCHRVIKSDGKTGNYTSGTDIKEFLLAHERRQWSVPE
ncbi:MAG TPA: methylated-DNA--[protein]-cysteine S-methyltransferase [Spirochaetota bacterium]|nr:methylated-DNA--[protein]-cysteine S-methyltransferase [Spirochaetota bacterium]HPQ53255.1 methylated-DNA--[protein]-cysteine S-methyltransferase [Spirochaetota bacterium]